MREDSLSRSNADAANEPFIEEENKVSYMKLQCMRILTKNVSLYIF